ncbi:MAG: DNA-processing protein DprA [Bacteroidia bacterium]|nr:DNA-processing protein DprA [Bacteroidia bacterium]
MSNNNLIAILALRQVKGAGEVAIKKLWLNGVFDNQSHYQIIEKALVILKKKISDEEIEEYVGLSKDTISKSHDNDVKLVDLSDSKYPKTLSEIKDPPSVLFYKGNLAAAQKSLGIIGTREADSIAIEIAKRLGAYFHEKGYSICNGLAIGVDEASITGEKGLHSNVVGVLAGGLNYNKTKTLLASTALMAEKVLENGGLILSEYECGLKEDTFKVIDSCRIQAGLSKGLILVQSKIDGGSKYTLKAFSLLNRPLGVINLNKSGTDLLFEANSIILNDTIAGLAKITGLKPDKILIDNAISISKKDDYQRFEKAISSLDSEFNGKLF